jgi:hypothetical protein
MLNGVLGIVKHYAFIYNYEIDANYFIRLTHDTYAFQATNFYPDIGKFEKRLGITGFHELLTKKPWNVKLLEIYE